MIFSLLKLNVKVKLPTALCSVRVGVELPLFLQYLISMTQEFLFTSRLNSRTYNVLARLKRFLGHWFQTLVIYILSPKLGTPFHSNVCVICETLKEMIISCHNLFLNIKKLLQFVFSKH